MGYRQALEAAGAIVHLYERFGSYQGDWWAKVTYRGTTGWVTGAYGSCSGCDAFEAELGSGVDEVGPNDLAEFGARYLDHVLDQWSAEQRAGRDADISMEDMDMLVWLRDHSIAPGVPQPLSLEQEFWGRNADGGCT